jgi:hypothetical protein
MSQFEIISQRTQNARRKYKEGWEFGIRIRILLAIIPNSGF